MNLQVNWHISTWHVCNAHTPDVYLKKGPGSTCGSPMHWLEWLLVAQLLFLSLVPVKWFHLCIQMQLCNLIFEAHTLRAAQFVLFPCACATCMWSTSIFHIWTQLHDLLLTLIQLGFGVHMSHRGQIPADAYLPKMSPLYNSCISLWQIHLSLNHMVYSQVNAIYICVCSLYILCSPTFSLLVLCIGEMVLFSKYKHSCAICLGITCRLHSVLVPGACIVHRWNDCICTVRDKTVPQKVKFHLWAKLWLREQRGNCGKIVQQR